MPDNEAIYIIVVEGQLNKEWTGWFNDLTISFTSEGNTRLSGPVRDQTALRGVLTRLWNLNLVLLSVERLPDKDDEPLATS